MEHKGRGGGWSGGCLLRSPCRTLLVACAVLRCDLRPSLRSCWLGPSFTGSLWPRSFPAVVAKSDWAKESSIPQRRAEGLQGENSLDISEAELESLGAALSKAKAALGDAPLTPEMAVMESPVLRQTMAVLHRYLQVNDEVALQNMADRLTAQLNSDSLDIDDLMGDVAKWEETKIALKDVKAALSRTATLFTLGTKQAEEAVVEEVAADGNLTARVGEEVVKFQLGRCADQLMWGPFTRFTVCYAPDSLNGKRVVFMELQDEGEMGVMKLQQGDKMFFADADRAVILDYAEYEKLPAVAENYMASVRTLRERGLQFDEVFAVDQQLMEAIQFWNKTGELSEDAQEEALFARACQSPLGQKLSQLLARDDQWRDVVAALQPKGRQVYTAARNALLRQFPAESPEPITIQVQRIRVDPQPSGVLITFVVALLVALVVVCFGGNETEQDNLPLYTLQKDAPQTASQLRFPLAGTPLAPFS
mmetsp:Transcript_43580/g.79374  ORF Transcript_43580/g.79374 Transcript_43580/m.79374 type:complete len:478 (-) Transcript_43580:9-1442(-)